METSYESGISEAQFAKIQPLLESSRKQTKPRILDFGLNTQASAPNTSHAGETYSL